MEEMWKDIPNLPSLQNPNNTFDGMNLQQFLATPFMYPNYNLNPVFPPTTTNVLLPTPQGGNSLSSSHQPMTCSSMQSGGGGARKRIAVSCKNEDQNNISSSSRTKQRLIKNRESAARSRDRKEAYTAHLANQLETLKAENAKLKMKQQLRGASQSLKKQILKRSTSSPF